MASAPVVLFLDGNKKKLPQQANAHIETLELSVLLWNMTQA
jgi:hypothetical protein